MLQCTGGSLWRCAWGRDISDPLGVALVALVWIGLGCVYCHSAWKSPFEHRVHYILSSKHLLECFSHVPGWEVNTGFGGNSAALGKGPCPTERTGAPWIQPWEHPCPVLVASQTYQEGRSLRRGLHLCRRCFES